MFTVKSNTYNNDVYYGEIVENSNVYYSGDHSFRLLKGWSNKKEFGFP